MEEKKIDERPATGWWSNPAFRLGVIASIVASFVFIYFVDPLLRSAWAIILFAGRWIYSGITDQIYVNAARGHRDWLGVEFVMFVDGVLSGILTGAVVVSLARARWGPATVEGLRRTGKRLAVAFVVLFVIVWILATHTAFTALADLRLNTSFSQRLTVLAPKLSDQEHKEFLAMWASMASRRDYERLNAVLEQTASSRGVKLPAPLLK